MNQRIERTTQIDQDLTEGVNVPCPPVLPRNQGKSMKAMSMSRSHLLSTQSTAASGKRSSRQSGLLRILLIGQKLRVEAPRALPYMAGRHAGLSPISDYEDVKFHRVADKRKRAGSLTR